MSTTPGGRLVEAADLAGTAVFALQGALTASLAGLDWLGGLVLAFVTALGGGIMRDVLLGVTPPAALQHRRYPGVVLVAVVAVIVAGGHPWAQAASTLRLLDAAGLALFAVAGTGKATDAGCRSFAAALLGTMSATGGGIVRDVLIAQVPAVLRVDIYATAALAGSVVLLAARRAGASAPVGAVAAFATCFGLRVAAIAYGWHLPRMSI